MRSPNSQKGIETLFLPSEISPLRVMMHVRHSPPSKVRWSLLLLYRGGALPLFLPFWNLALGVLRFFSRFYLFFLIGLKPRSGVSSLFFLPPELHVFSECFSRRTVPPLHKSPGQTTREVCFLLSGDREESIPTCAPF